MIKLIGIGLIALSLTACGQQKPLQAASTPTPEASSTPAPSASSSIPPSPAASPSPSVMPTAAPTASPTVKPSPSPHQTPTAAPAVKQPEVPKATVKKTEVYYSNCTDAKNHGAYNIKKGEPGYRDALDRDHDGIACEK